MFSICTECGEYRPDQIIGPEGPRAVCPECGHRRQFRSLPLFLVGGASGCGKSAVCQALLGEFDEVVVLDSDILWRPEFDQPHDRYRDIFENWLRMCKNIGQSGPPVLLFGAGFAVPGNVETRVERRYFSAVHYLALTCDAGLMLRRLRKRPAWRACSSPEYQVAQLEFNRWVREQASLGNPPVSLVDTSRGGVIEAASLVRSWVLERL